MNLVRSARSLGASLALVTAISGGISSHAFGQSRGSVYDSLSVTVRAGAAPFLFKFVQPAARNDGSGLHVEVWQNGAVRQTFTLEDPSQGGCRERPSNCVKVRDINFDGYVDLQIFRNSAGQDRDWTFLRYDPKNRIFVADEVLNGASGNVTLDPKEKIVTFTWVGEAGSEYGVSDYRWSGDRFVLVHDVRNVRQPDHEHAIRTVREMRKGTLTVVSTETVMAEDVEN